MVNNKTWRNCELVLYPESTSIDVLKQGLQIADKWAYILHDRDEGKKTHWHVMLSFIKPKNTSTICNAFRCNENQIERIKTKWVNALAYLTHDTKTSKDKYQYPKEDVKANFEWEKEIEQGTKIDRVIDKIGTGEIRSYNLTDFITVSEYTKHRRIIESAFKWRDSYVLAHLEELVEMKNVNWIYGEPGTGKTSFAKQLSKTAGMFYKLTSTGRNMFDEYQDEPCLIIDDLRPEDMSFNDMLGVLDPYNFKAAAARYKNKNLQTQLLIVTSTMSPETYLQAATKDSAIVEDKRQLYRRIAFVYEVTEDRIYEYEYAEDNITRVKTKEWPNFINQLMKREERKSTSSLIDKMMESAFDALPA